MANNICDKPSTCKSGNQGGQIGHRKNTAKGKVKFLHGNGCHVCENCLDCPLPDCTWSA